jgi:hypothetical protein
LRRGAAEAIFILLDAWHRAQRGALAEQTITPPGACDAANDAMAQNTH